MALDPTIPLQVLNPAQVAQATQATQLNNQKLQLGQQDLQKGQIDIQTDQINQAMQKNENVIQLLQGVKDQPSYDAAKQNAASMGLPVDHLPPNYDPNTIKQLTDTALSVKDRLQIQAMQGYRQGMLGLKAVNTFGSVQEAAANGYGPAADGSGTWQPLPAPAQPVPALGGGNAATIPAPAQPSGITNTAATVPAIRQAAAANPPPLLPAFGQQDPVAASNAAIAAQQQITGVSSAQRPDLANLPAAQVAAMPVNGAAVTQQPTAPQVANAPAQSNIPTQAAAEQPLTEKPAGWTMTKWRQYQQGQGIGSTSPTIYAANRIMADAAKAGNPVTYETAFALAKKGLGEGQSFDVKTGQVGNIAGATDATAQMAQAKDEGAQYGKGLGEQMDQYRTVAQAAQGMDATLNAMKADSQNFRMGAMSDMQGTAKSYLQAIAQGLGVKTPEMDTSLGAQQAFTKSAMGLVMGGMQKVQGRAFGEMKAIQSAFPTQAMSQGGFDLVTNQIAGTNQYSEAMYQAAQNYKAQNGTLDGFESNFQKNVSPWAYVVKTMDPQSLGALSKTLSSTPQGQKELHMLADQIDYATKNGLMQ